MTAIRNRIPKQAPFWLLCAVALVLPACESDGHFSILGYTTVPNYDCNIHTVYVPIFTNNSPIRGIEFDLTQEVIKQIEQITPFKVVHNCECADTELLGTIMSYNKSILNRNQQNEVREAEMGLIVQVIWRDRRTGDVLSGPGTRLSSGPLMGAPAMATGTNGQPVAQAPGTPGVNAATQTTPGNAPVGVPVAGAGGVPGTPLGAPGAPPGPTPVLASSYASYIPEIGQSNASAQQKNMQRCARQIVGMMEQGW